MEDFRTYYLDGRKFRDLLTQKGYRSVNDFAFRAGVHRNTLRMYLSQKKSVFSEAFVRMTQVLKTDPMALVFSQSSFINVTAQMLTNAIAEIVKIYPSVAFLLLGSRAKGSAKDHSDWDIGITGGVEPFKVMDYLKIKSLMEEASTNAPESVDVVNLDGAPKSFLQGLSYIPIFLGGNVESKGYFLGKLHGAKKAA